MLHSSFLLGLSFLFVVWGQGADRNTSASLLRRRAPKRVLCNECISITSVGRFIRLGLTGVALLLLAGGGYFAWSAESLPWLRLSALGLGVYLIRHDLTFYLGKLIE